MNNNLDRYRGTFNTSHAFAEKQATEILNNYRKNNAIDQKNSEINDLIDECELLEDKLDDANESYNSLMQKARKIQELHKQDVADFNTLLGMYNSLLDENKALSEKNQQLSNEQKLLEQKNGIQKAALEDTVTAMKSKYAAYQSAVADKEQSNVALIKTLSYEKNYAEFALKVFYTQNEIKNNFIERLTSQGLISKEMLSAFLGEKLYILNKLDAKNGDITYAESLAWLKQKKAKILEKI